MSDGKGNPDEAEGGGVVSSDPEELSFVEELPSLFDAPDEDAGGVVVGFMETNIEAASRSWTCWCLDMRSLDVYDHSGVCSHLCRGNKSIIY
jgi:hypothetical protein